MLNHPLACVNYSPAVLRYDEDEDAQKFAIALWQQWEAAGAAAGRGLGLSEAYWPALAPLLSHSQKHVRDSAARAMAGGIPFRLIH